MGLVFNLILSLLWITYLLLISTQTDYFKSLKERYFERKLKKAFTVPLVDIHLNIHYWQQGDELVYKKTLNVNSTCELKTFSRYQVIAIDKFNNQKLLLPAEFILENTTCKFRRAALDAEHYQQNILPEIQKQYKELTS